MLYESLTKISGNTPGKYLEAKIYGHLKTGMF